MDKQGKRDLFLNTLKSFTPTEKACTKPLTHQTMQDLKEMLQYVPPCRHRFYLKLPQDSRRNNAAENEEEDVLPNVEGDDCE